MGQLRGMTITYNGICSERFGLYLCDVGNTNRSRSFGAKQILETEEGVNDTPIFKKLKKSVQSFDIQLVKLSKNRMPLPITEDELFEINRWLFSPSEYKPLIVDKQDIVYYGVFTEGNSWQNESDEGYLTLKFQMDSPYGYSTIQNSDCRVKGEKTIILTSKHNAQKYNEVDIEFLLDEGQTQLIIENLTTGQRMEFDNLDDSCRHVYVYNEGIKHVISKTNPNVNMLPKFNRVFIRLAYGSNNIKIYGSGRVRFISQAKILLQ